MEIRKLERWINISASFCSLWAFIILISTRIESFNLQIILQYLFGTIFIIAIWGLILYFLSKLWKWGKEINRLFFLSIFLVIMLIAMFVGIFCSMVGIQLIKYLFEIIFMLLAEM